MAKEKYSIRTAPNEHFVIIDNESYAVVYVGNTFEECQNVILDGTLQQAQAMCDLYCD